MERLCTGSDCDGIPCFPVICWSAPKLLKYTSASDTSIISFQINSWSQVKIQPATFCISQRNGLECPCPCYKDYQIQKHEKPRVKPGPCNHPQLKQAKLRPNSPIFKVVSSSFCWTSTPFIFTPLLDIVFAPHFCKDCHICFALC